MNTPLRKGVAVTNMQKELYVYSSTAAVVLHRFAICIAYWGKMNPMCVNSERSVKFPHDCS